MTKLMQWLFFVGIFSAVWGALITEKIPVQLSSALYEVVLVSPLYLLMTFACYSLAVIGYRVAMFNDCPEAADELKGQIKEARKELTKKGFKF